MQGIIRPGIWTPRPVQRPRSFRELAHRLITEQRAMLSAERNAFNWWAQATQAAGTIGASLTPGNNTYGTYVEILADLAEDAYEIVIAMSAGNTSTAARDIIIDIGSDPAGGTSYASIITGLLASCSGGINTSAPGLIWYRFPLYIKAGTAIAAKASVNNATVGTCRVYAIVFGKPTRPELTRSGSYVDAYGVTAASSSGTAVTPGTSGAKGSYVALGGTASRDYWWTQYGLGVNDGSMTSGNWRADLAFGDVTNKHLIFEDDLIVQTSGEVIMRDNARSDLFACKKIPTGAQYYGRLAWSTGTADSNASMAAYGLGG